jgi:DNA-binding transcriptional LysR family regulator
MTFSLLGPAARYFLEVARTGSISQAAEQLHVAASAVSRQVSKLEESLGTPLFERKSRGMLLNASGERLAAHVRAAMLDGLRAADDVRALAIQSSSKIRIACTEGFARSFMPQVMSSFRRTHPECTIEALVGLPDEVSRLLMRGEVNVGLKFAVSKEEERGLLIAHRQPAPLMVLCAPTHALAKRKTVSLTDITQHPLALPHAGTTVRQMLDLVCALAGVHYQMVYSGSSALLLTLTLSGEVLMFSSRISAAQEISSGTLVALSLNEPQFQQRELRVLTLDEPGLPSIHAAFMQHLIKLASTQAPR